MERKYINLQNKNDITLYIHKDGCFLFCDNCKSLMKIETEDKIIKYVCYSCGGNTPMDNANIENVFYKEKGQKFEIQHYSQYEV